MRKMRCMVIFNWSANKRTCMLCAAMSVSAGALGTQQCNGTCASGRCQPLYGLSSFNIWSSMSSIASVWGCVIWLCTCLGDHFFWFSGIYSNSVELGMRLGPGERQSGDGTSLPETSNLKNVGNSYKRTHANTFWEILFFNNPTMRQPIDVRRICRDRERDWGGVSSEWLFTCSRWSVWSSSPCTVPLPPHPY